MYEISWRYGFKLQSGNDFMTDRQTDNLGKNSMSPGERGGSVVECRTPEREVRGSRPTSAVLCPWARHFTPRKYWLITQEAMAPSRHDWKIVDWDVKPQHNQPNMSPNPKGEGGWGRLNDPKIGRVSFYCRVMIPKDATELQTVRPWSDCF